MSTQDDFIIRWRGTTAYRFPAHHSYVYLLHFSEKLGNPSNARGQAQHYLGSTGNLDARLHLHHNGNGSAIMTAVGKAAISWQVCRLWRFDSCEDARKFEARLKRRHESPLFCPLCNPRVAPDALVQLRQGHWPLSRFAQPGRRQPMTDLQPVVFVRR